METVKRHLESAAYAAMEKDIPIGQFLTMALDAYNQIDGGDDDDA